MDNKIEECIWKYETSVVMMFGFIDGDWRTSCGKLFDDISFKFCPNCGKKIKK